ncbi:spore germination protein [Inediibacterium massiliense]|uniref:spore germination protein n=1 Tax=Inediibacterium massiliense TaxID=1658111 RepID=UPI0006B50A39|nr:spore germination protein [Inediibacterium massiliense]
MNNKKLWIERLQQIDGEMLIKKISMNGQDIFLAYLPLLTNKKMISEYIIKPILNEKNEKVDIQKLLESILYIDDAFLDEDMDKLENYILKGYSIIFCSHCKNYIVANTKKTEKRSVSPPELETTLRAPKDAFTESLETNLSLIRSRIKDKSLKMDFYCIGTRTQTDVVMMYMEDIANEEFVEEVKEKLSKIHIDGILESGYIQKILLDNTFDLFPQTGIAERSDTVCANILEGKIAIFVEGSNLALIVPKIFIEFLDAGEDHYDNLYLGIFSKVLRIFSLFSSLLLSSLYVAVVSFHTDILPPQFILALATSRTAVPFNSIIEAVLMELVVEILREASIRLPKQVGPAIGIVGAIVIGQAAVAAGVISPLIVIIVSLAMLCSFVAPDYTIMSPFRILKFMIIFFTGILGLFGLVMGITLIVIHLSSLTTLGIPYLSVLSPFHREDLKKYFLSEITLAKKRPSFLRTKNPIRK